MTDERYLVVIETQRVKGYLFTSPILRETRGASLLLDRLNRQRTQEILKERGGREIYLGGGAGRALFKQEEEARRFRREVKALYREEAPHARVSIEIVRRELYRRGFSPQHLAPSQMAAFGELLAWAADRAEAETAARKWMQHQLEKLQEEEKRKGTRRSWLMKPVGEGAADSLGEELLAWMAGDSFLGGGSAQDLDRLEALRRFWARLHGFYRYEIETGKEMSLAALDRRTEEGGSR